MDEKYNPNYYCFQPTVGKFFLNPFTVTDETVLSCMEWINQLCQIPIHNLLQHCSTRVSYRNSLAKR